MALERGTDGTGSAENGEITSEEKQRATRY